MDEISAKRPMPKMFHGIPKIECKNRWLYLLISRNLKFGVYDEKAGLTTVNWAEADTGTPAISPGAIVSRPGTFVGLREELTTGHFYLSKEYHRDCGGTVAPVEALCELPDDLVAVARGQPLSAWLREMELKYADKVTERFRK